VLKVRELELKQHDLQMKLQAAQRQAAQQQIDMLGVGAMRAAGPIPMRQ
jgi:hypothetical protein